MKGVCWHTLMAKRRSIKFCWLSKRGDYTKPWFIGGHLKILHMTITKLRNILSISYVLEGNMVSRKQNQENLSNFIAMEKPSNRRKKFLKVNFKKCYSKVQLSCSWMKILKISKSVGQLLFLSILLYVRKRCYYTLFKFGRWLFGWEPTSFPLIFIGDFFIS